MTRILNQNKIWKLSGTNLQIQAKLLANFNFLVTASLLAGPPGSSSSSTADRITFIKY